MPPLFLKALSRAASEADYLNDRQGQREYQKRHSNNHLIIATHEIDISLSRLPSV